MGRKEIDGKAPLVEKKLQQVIRTVETNRYSETGPNTRMPGERKGDCDSVSLDILEEARKQGLTGYTLFVDELQERRGAMVTLWHVLAVIENFGVDLTFCQFEDKNGTAYDAPVANANHTLKDRLRRDGYFELTDDTLNDYLDLLNLQGNNVRRMRMIELPIIGE